MDQSLVVCLITSDISRLSLLQNQILIYSKALSLNSSSFDNVSFIHLCSHVKDSLYIMHLYICKYTSAYYKVNPLRGNIN